MITGTYLLTLAVVAAMLSLVGYFYVARGNSAYVVAARWSYYAMSTLVVIAVVMLINYLLNSRFEYNYVSNYSSLGMPANFKVTSLWAGQEGSFLLWLALAVLLGLWVKAKAKEQLGWVMFFYLLGQIFLLSLLMISSPFKLNAVVPLDGKGLNPLLQNYWMQIHPPIVFLGFASTFVPFAFAMVALANKKYDNWVRLTFPWAILSVCTLGLGTFLGGYWAYETLGWGGYWAWDPVENAVLVPWLASIALVHGMILERTKGTFRKTNLFMAVTAFMMTIYGTFLTRSGILADFSVHSFVDLGYAGYLVAFLVGFAVIAYGMLIMRAKSIPSNEPGKSPLTKDFAVYLGMLFVILSGFLVLIGMSAPLLTRIWGEPSAVSMSYYVITNLPIGIIIGLILGIAPFLAWRNATWNELLRKAILPTCAAIIITIIAAIWGVNKAAHLLFVFSGAFAFFGNLQLLIDQLRKGITTVQADLIHAGVGLMFLGIIISSAYSPQQKVTFNLNDSKDVLGFNFKFDGTQEIASNKLQTNMTVTKGSSIFTASPVFMQSNQGLVRNPYIKKFFFYDLYISPEEIQESPADQTANSIILIKGETKTIEGREITFKQFDVGSHMDEQTGGMTIGAVLDVKSMDGKTETIKPTHIMTSTDHAHYEPVKLPGTNKNVYLLKISADEGLIALGITAKDNPSEFTDQLRLILDISIKPMINFVWIGLLMIVLGSGWSVVRRIREVKPQPQ